jgi:hypothetical protein
MKNGRFYEHGKTQGFIYLYTGEGQQKEQAKSIYDNFSKQADFEVDGEFNTDKASFISGWVDAMMD